MDLVFRRKEENNEESYPDYIKGLKGQLEYAYSLAAANVAKSQEYQQASQESVAFIRQHSCASFWASGSGQG